MSYAGPTRARGATSSASASAASRTPFGRPTPPREIPLRSDTDWNQVALFGAGLALGLAVGAGATLLAAPRSGAETRAVLRAKVGRARRSTSRRGRDAWDDLRDEIRGVKRALKRRKARRAAERDLRREVERELVLD